MSSVANEKSKFSFTTDTRVSRYDVLSGALTASAIIFGVLVTIMFLMWLMLFVKFGGSPPSAVVMEMTGNDNRPEGEADDWKEPGVTDFPEVETPQLADALEATTDAVSSVRAQLEKVDGSAELMGKGTGLGDIRSRGPGNGNDDIIPDAERWKVEITAATQSEYLKILESFDITLGAVSELSNLIEYVDNLTAGSPAVSNGERKVEKRLFFMNTRNKLRRWDQNKVNSAGIDLEYKLVGHFYPPQLRQQLLDIESAVYTKAGHNLLEVYRTFFRIEPEGSGYRYYVERIEYRPAPRPASPPATP